MNLMARKFWRVGALASAIVISAPAYADHGYAISRYHENEQQMLHWDSRYRASRAGSWEERYADQQRRNHGQWALDSISAPGALAGYPKTELESFAWEVDQKYRNSPGGSYVESVYLQSAEIAWRGYVDRGVWELRVAPPSDFRGALSAALDADAKYRNAPGGSRREYAYRQLLTQAYDIAREKLATHLRETAYAGYLDAENLGLEFYQQYRVAPGGSYRETFYRDGARMSFDEAVNRLRGQVYSMTDGELYRLQGDYQARYRAAPGGSMVESYYSNVLSVIRQELDRRLSNPYPVPPVPPTPPVPPRPVPPSPPGPPVPPVPPPPPVPSLVTCYVTTARGTYVGTGFDRPSAAAAARNRCLRVETSYSCNTGSLVCQGG